MNWVVQVENDAEEQAFRSADACLQLPGSVVSDYGLNLLRKVGVLDRNYYVKMYRSRGRGLRRYLGRSRARAEWENLQLFQKLGVPSPRVVAYGESSSCGVLVTEEVVGAIDLETFTGAAVSGAQFDRVMGRLADHVRCMHLHGFVHNDLKWRNILVAYERCHRELDVYIIDSPMGRRVISLLLPRRVVKDLACLDKVAKYRLTRTQRLRFYLKYREIDRLRATDKRQLRRILHFFEGRE